VDLTAGTHTLTVGGWNNKKTSAREITEILFDDVQVVGVATEIDADGDGMPDDDESSVYHTNPNNPDTDGDGIDDGDELDFWGSDWDMDFDEDGLINLVDFDSDGDDFSDGIEVREGSDPLDPGTIPSPINPGEETGALEAHFASDGDGFTYADDTFYGTNHPAYASGNYDPAEGFSGGGLQVALGGVDSVDITDGMSGGWSNSFRLNEDGIVTISLRYRLICSSKYEPDECSQVLVAIDGTFVGGGPEDFLTEICGGGTTGWQQVSFDVDLTAGTHTLTVGGWNNQKTRYTETTEVFFDDVQVES
jgi:hypothetical protein